jgi:hypothetical protein
MELRLISKLFSKINIHSGKAAELKQN